MLGVFSGQAESVRGADSQLMVMPSSTPRLLGSFTWKVPLLGMTDSGCKQTHTHVRLKGRASGSPCPTPILVQWGGTPNNPILLLAPTDEETETWCTDLLETSTHQVRAESVLEPKLYGCRLSRGPMAQPSPFGSSNDLLDASHRPGLSWWFHTLYLI